MDAMQFLRLIFIDENIGDVRVSIKDSGNRVNVWKPDIIEDVTIYMDEHGYTKLSIVEMKVTKGVNGARGFVYMTCTAE